MSTSPAFAATPRAVANTITTANTARDGTGTMVTLFTAGSNGSRVERITVTAGVTTAAGSITIFVFDGTTTRLWKEIPVTAVTASTTVATYTGQLSGLGLLLANGFSLKGATQVVTGQPFNVLVEGGDF